MKFSPEEKAKWREGQRAAKLHAKRLSGYPVLIAENGAVATASGTPYQAILHRFRNPHPEKGGPTSIVRTQLVRIREVKNEKH